MKVIDGHVITCSKCMAPWTRPFPEGWTLTVRRAQGIQWVYLHTEDCPRKFKEIVVPE